MRKYSLLILAVLVLGILWWLFAHRQSAVVPKPNDAISSIAKPVQNGIKTNIAAKTKVTEALSKSQSTNAGIPQYRLEYVQKVKADPYYDWKQPINFWGKVVDKSNIPIAGARIHFIWNDLSPTGTSQADVKSGSDGLFSLLNKTGKGITVTVTKEGYYSTSSSRQSFEYADPNNGLFKPDQRNPIIFHLRKKGPGVDLITSKYGVSPDFPIHVPRDGTPVTVDLMKRKIGNSGQMQISESKPDFKDWKQAANWSFRIEIPDGGFVGENDEFPFEAPSSGYQSVEELDFQKGSLNWTTDIKTNFYIKFGNPPLYGRLQIKTGISYGGAFLTYAINPTGSRSLEPK